MPFLTAFRPLSPIVFLCFCLLPAVLFKLHAADLPTGFSETLVAQGMDPTDMVIVNDGRILISVKSGRVLIVEDGILRPAPLLNIESNVDNFNERGLGHIVLDPNFDLNGYFYLYYTVADQSYNRISRFTAVGNFSDPTSEQIIFDLDVVPGTIHNAGDLAFGLDGKLYVGVGDGADANQAQRLTSVLGKVLRINADGTIPADNPFVVQANGKYKAIFALGLRNPYSLDIDQVTGAIFVSEVGQESWEEVNKIEAGRNYGWPGIEGRRNGQALPSIGTYADPIYAYPHGAGTQAGCAIVGAAFYRPQVQQFPESFSGRFFFADYCNGYMKSMDPLLPADIQIFAQGIDRPLAVVIDSNGDLYYLARGGLGGGSETDNTSSNEGTLWKVTYNGTGEPRISVPPQDALVSVGETADFSISATGAELFYQWQMNDVDIPGAISRTFQFVNAQQSDDGKTFRCVIRNTFGTVTSLAATLAVTANSRPEPQFTWALPSGGTLYEGGQMLSFSGAATDAEDGALSAASLSWKINFFHDLHFHPALPPTSGQSNFFYLIPQVGETSANVWYRIYLTATDQGDPALSKTIYQDVFPKTANISISTTPPNLSILVDGQYVNTPYTFTSVVNSKRALEAPASQTRNDSLFIFSQWTDVGESPAFTFDTPATGGAYSANFEYIPGGTGTGLLGYYFTNQDKTFKGSPTVSRVDPELDFDWGAGSPDPKLSAESFTVRWVGEIMPQFTDTYTFYLKGDDGVRLWVDDNLLIDKWVDQALTEWSSSMELIAGNKYPVRIDYYERTGQAAVSLSWSSANTPKQVIPRTQLFSDLVTGIETRPTSVVSVFPTLVGNELFVECPTLTGSVEEWVVTDMMGRTISSGLLEEKLTISTAHWSTGLYIFRTSQSYVRIIKNR